MAESERVELRLLDRVHNLRDSDLVMDIRRMPADKLSHCLSLLRKYLAIEMGKDHPNLDFINKWRKAQKDYQAELAFRDSFEARQGAA